MFLTDFWTEILSKIEGHERVIFITKKQSRSVRTTTAGIIPENIIKLQAEFYKSFKEEHRIQFKSNHSLQLPELAPEKPLVIMEFEKMQKEIEDYYMKFPDAANLETGMLLEKINDIRSALGLAITE